MQFSVKCRIAMAHAFLYHSAPSPNWVVSRGQTLPRGRVWPRETRPEVLKHPSSAVIAFFAVLKVKHPSSDVVAFYEGRGDTIHYANMGPAQDSSYTGVQYSLGNLVWGYNNSGYQIHHDWLFQKQCGGGEAYWSRYTYFSNLVARTRLPPPNKNEWGVLTYGSASWNPASPREFT